MAFFQKSASARRWVGLFIITIGLLSGIPSPVSADQTSDAKDIQAAHEILSSTSIAFNQVANKATPAVVSVNSIKIISAEEAALANPFGGGSGDSHGGGGGPGIPGAPGGQEPGFGIGSGVIIREDGIILTNNHVVENAERVMVGLDDKKQVKARVLGADPKTDIAVIKIEEKVGSLPTIKFGNSDQVKVGDWAVAIGSPFGLNHTVTSGIISAKGRGQMGVLDTEDFIQTDAAINPGNSGGPLLNLTGEMIGLNAAIFSQSGGFIGIGFSIPSNLVSKISEELIAHGRVKRGWLGLLTQDLDPSLASYFQVPSNKGALISQVDPSGPAAKGSIQVGDVITRFDNRLVDNSTGLKEMVAKSREGQKVPVEVIRKGRTKSLNFVIQEQPTPPRTPTQQAGQISKTSQSGKPQLGLTLQDIPDEFASMGLVPGTGALVVNVRPGSPAFDSGIVPGDIIMQANGQKIRDANDFVRFSKKLKFNDSNVLYVQRGLDKKIFVPLKNQT